MKKTLCTLLSLFLLATLTLGQESSYVKGDKIIQAGFSAGTFGYGFYGSRSGFTLPFNAAAELGFHKFLSAGPYVGFARWKYDYAYGDYSWTFFSIGGRISAHYIPFINEWWGWDIDEKKFDFYLTGLLGLEFRTFDMEETGISDDFYDNETHLIIGPVLGFRYMLTDSWALYFEGGRGALGYGTLGASLRF